MQKVRLFLGFGTGLAVLCGPILLLIFWANSATSPRDGFGPGMVLISVLPLLSLASLAIGLIVGTIFYFRSVQKAFWGGFLMGLIVPAAAVQALSWSLF